MCTRASVRCNIMQLDITHPRTRTMYSQRRSVYDVRHAVHRLRRRLRHGQLFPRLVLVSSNGWSSGAAAMTMVSRSRRETAMYGASIRGLGQLRQPIPRPQKILVQPLFRRAWLRLVVVFPPHQRRQRHQYRFDAAARLQPEDRSPVIDQVEFNITSPAVQLEVPFALAVRRVLALLDDRQVGRHVADRPRCA